MRREPHAQGRESIWIIQLEGRRHVVELESGYSANTWVVWVDGAMRTSPSESVQGAFTFTIGVHPCRMETRGTKPALYVDERLIAPFQGEQFLLRPSEASATSDQLLRPASNASVADENLLRPRDAEPAGD